MARIENSMPFLLQNEGGFVNDPADPGGATKYGITRATLSHYRGRRCSVEDVQNLTVAEATKIYRLNYWNVLNLDLVVIQKIATAIFDMAVVRGPSTAAMYAQQALVRLNYTLPVDGHIGVRTLSALNTADPTAFLREFERLSEQGFLAIVQAKPERRRFLRGWLARARRLLGL